MAVRRGAGGSAPWSLLLILVAIPSGASGAWLQAGYDAARTGATPDDGPETDDVAWIVEVPASNPGEKPIILDDGVYVLGDAGFPDQGRKTNAIFRIGIEDSALSTIVDLGTALPANWASDGGSFYVQFRDRVAAYPVAGGAARWTWTMPASLPVHVGMACQDLALLGGMLFLSCTETGYLAAPGPGGEQDCRSRPWAVALETAAGTPVWTWTRDEPAIDTGLGSFAVIADTFVAARTELVGQAYGPCTSGPIPASADTAARSYGFVALDANTGARLWQFNATTRNAASSTVVAPAPLPSVGPLPAVPGVVNEPPPVYAHPTGTSTGIFAKAGDVYALNGRGGVLWNVTTGREDQFNFDVSAGFALSPDALFVASSQTIYRLDPSSGVERWKVTIDPRFNESWGSGPNLVVAGGRIYGRAATGASELRNSIYAFDATTGSQLWRHPFTLTQNITGRRFFEWSVGAGVIALHGIDGRVYLLGESAASLHPVAVASSEYPAPGAPVTLDLSGTGPGVAGAAQDFRVEWGDGGIDDWEASVVFGHTYAEPGDRTVRYQARNGAGQTASGFLTMHVGATPPPELNPVQEAFAPRNMDTTLSLLGLAIALAGAMYGAWRLRRRRNRLHHELAAIDLVYARTKDRPAECEVALAERRAHARGLLVDGGLDETQFAVIKGHIDELAHGLRLSTLDGRFDYLPLGMVKTLREMLEDGRISAWEHRHFVEALERDRLLSGEQKAEVRRLIDGWFTRDSGTPAAGQAQP